MCEDKDTNLEEHLQGYIENVIDLVDVENRFKSFYIWEYANNRSNYQKMLPKTLRILTLMKTVEVYQFKLSKWHFVETQKSEGWYSNLLWTWLVNVGTK